MSGDEAVAERDEALEDFIEAERALFDRLELTGKSTYMTAFDPPVKVRLFENGKGVPVLFVHGGGTGAWAPILPHLQGIRAIVPDRPGFGLSGEGPDYHQVDYRDYAVDFIEAVLDHLGLDKVILVGNSGGALWSFFFALDRPERVAGMAHLGAPALLLEAVRPRGETQAQREQIASALQRFGHERHLPRMLPEFLTVFEVGAKLPGRLATYRSGTEVLLPPEGTPKRFMIHEADLRSIHVPVLLVWGGQDPLGHLEQAERAIDFLPDGELVWLPDSGHLPWLDHLEICGALVSDFVRRNAPG